MIIPGIEAGGFINRKRLFFIYDPNEAGIMIYL
jgi:hypothetical protein